MRTPRIAAGIGAARAPSVRVMPEIVTASLVLDPRFYGPPSTANGGYAFGELVDGPAEVTLVSPPPLRIPLDVGFNDGLPAALLAGGDYHHLADLARFAEASTAAYQDGGWWSRSPTTPRRSLMWTRRRTHRRRIAAAVVAALVVPVAAPAAAVAVPADQQYPRPVSQTSGPTTSDSTQLAPKAGDTKVDSPGASRAPQYDQPRTIQIVRPERTIVRDTDTVLPIALSGAALLVALGLAGTQLVRARSLRLS